MKAKKLTLTYPHFDNDKINVNERMTAPRVWRVKSVTNSTEYVPMQQLRKKEVDELCAASGWDVKIEFSYVEGA